MSFLKKLLSLFSRKKKLPEEEGFELQQSSLGRDWQSPPESKYFSPRDE